MPMVLVLFPRQDSLYVLSDDQQTFSKGPISYTVSIDIVEPSNRKKAMASLRKLKSLPSMNVEHEKDEHE